MNIETKIRYLAKSVYFQNLYNSAKEINGVHLFENHNNFSGLQVLFLFWLRIYESLYTDIGKKEWKYLDENVIKNDIRCDAFLYWRGQIYDQKMQQYKQEEQIGKLKLKDKSNVNTFNVDFQG